MQFDIPGWLANVIGCAREELTYESEREVGGVLTISYSRGGMRLATVDLAALPLNDSQRAAWELLARFRDHVERVEVPATTRFVWR